MSSRPEETHLGLIPLAGILVPIDRCFTLSEGPVPLKAIEELERRDFSQALIHGQDQDLFGNAYGVVPISRLKELNREGVGLTLRTPGVDRFLLDCAGTHDWRNTVRAEESRADGTLSTQDRLRVMEPTVGLGALLDCLSQRAAVLVGCHDPVSWGGAELVDPPEPIGLVTISDLNKHPLRAAIYPLLALLEGLLADIVEYAYEDDPWRLIMQLTSEDSRARVVGYWKLSEREGVSVGPTAGATLSELLRVAGASEDLRHVLGYESRSSFEAATKHIHRFRNLTMHPVRPLITSQKDCAELKHALTVAVDLCRRLTG